MRRVLCVALVSFGALAPSVGVLAPPAGARPLTLGYFDTTFINEPATAPQWLDRARGSGASLVRLGVNWADIAPRELMPGFDAANPADPGYRWAQLDNAVNLARARGLRVLVAVGQAPEWAQAPGRPDGIPQGAWRPDAEAFGLFARALGRRYAGRVGAWEVWNEANLDLYLAPQWVKTPSGFDSVGPEIYRGLVNAFAGGMRAADRAATIVAGVTAPYGDHEPGGHRIPPVTFDQEFLCLRGGVRVKGCPDVDFDVLSHHPYGVGNPQRRAVNAADVTIADMGKLTSLLAQARRLGTVSRNTTRTWVTEISYDTSPPDPDGVPLATQARWLSQTVRNLQRAGIDTIVWFNIRDQAPVPSYAESYQSGTFYRDGMPKPSARAFALPFTVDRVGSRAAIWVRTPLPRQVVRVEERRAGRWRARVRLRSDRNGIVRRSVSGPRRPLRVTAGDRTSLAG